MKATIYLPEKLEKAVRSYLEIYPEKTLSGLIQETLEQRVMPRKSRLLDLAGFAELKPLRRTPEQIAEDERERPEDEPAKHGW